MPFILYLASFLPSIIWLLFYLRKDAHPESNKMVIKIFIFGFLASFLLVITAGTVMLVFKLNLSAKNLPSSPFLQLLYFIIAAGLIEEYVKYLVVKFGVFKTSELDEPVDLMIYMIISALGFAALENILYIFSAYSETLEVSSIEIAVTASIIVLVFRFAIATLIHAFCSAIFGYFIAISFLKTEQRRKYFWQGLVLAASLHGFLDWFIMESGNIFPQAMIFSALPTLILIICLSIFISIAFAKLKKIKGICQISQQAKGTAKF